MLSKVMGWLMRPRPTKDSVLYLAAFFKGNAGYHWRVEKWADILQQEGKFVEIKSSMTVEELDRYEENPSKFLIRELRRRFWQVVQARHFETVVVRREVWIFSPYGNHFLEKLLQKLCKNVILDFDDDLSAAKNEPKAVESTVAKWMLEDGNSFRNSWKYYNKFIVASSYLKECLLNHGIGIKGANVSVIPTCVDYDQYERKNYKEDEVIRLGWIGSANNFHYLQHIEGHLNKIYHKTPFEFIVISKDCAFQNAQFPVIYKNWSLASEVEDLRSIDVGLMPLFDCEETKGKGGFKLIQYMGLGIVGVASAITINTEIVEDGENSFLIYNETQWAEVLQKILNKEIDLDTIGRLARRKVDNNYTFEANKNLYLALINKKHI